MGIFCEINLCRPADGKYTYQPGSIISGDIRYHLHEEYEFTAITVSLKGLGHLYIEDNTNKRRHRSQKYTNDDVYVDINNVIYTNDNGPIPIGQYEHRFSFQLPYNIPPSTDFEKTTYDYYVHCYIKYYIRIKFERPGWFKSNKRYEKELNVISEQIPRLTTEPLIYGEQKNLLQLSSLFSNKKGIVNLKATIDNSVLRQGECVKLDYEINNDTNKTIKDVQVRMFEVDKYTTKEGYEIRVHTEIGGVGGVIHEAIPGGEVATFTTDVPIPKNCVSIDHSRFFSRDYSVVTFVRLPDPHVNMLLEIPFQIINVLSSGLEDIACCSRVDYARDAPPSYWEAMGEDTRYSLENQA